MRGGYKIIDLKGHTLTLAASVTVPGIYEAIEGSYKAFLIENLTFVAANEATVELPATFTNFTKVGTDFKTFVQTAIYGETNSFITYEITVGDDDAVSLAYVSELFAAPSVSDTPSE